ncbi:DUF4199 domain-containing protein [Croceitalea rosinachiae]|uniref:DUF4199 domain-containing protein n=1 Tax=Croceitalea rosinachiae TaxID=3075596 RepID=A0ABU3A9V5_9FLAO|nr:DUF4199 domain-containing protein [Croceitalea sp. F388]MDT0605863.1 DUF4199 domain-containing protein [Croceitalea sp. F388]
MKSSIIKFSTYGILFGFISFLAGLYFDFTTNEVFGYATIVASLLFVYFGIRHFRDKQNSGKLSFKKGMAIGLLISLFTAIGIGIADYLYTAIINPDFLDEYGKMMQAKDPSVEIMELTSGQAALFMLAIVFIIGLIITLISSLILQRK